METHRVHLFDDVFFPLHVLFMKESGDCVSSIRGTYRITTQRMVRGTREWSKVSNFSLTDQRENRR